MFRCDKCKRVTNPGEKATKVVIEYRDKDYPNGGHGKEIVKEITVCDNCKVD